LFIKIQYFLISSLQDIHNIFQTQQAEDPKSFPTWWAIKTMHHTRYTL